jgi:small subunit ribosomal protein S20
LFSRKIKNFFIHKNFVTILLKYIKNIFKFILKQMNKKQRNRKNVAQNLRNRLINRRYLSRIKNLKKMLILNSKYSKEIENKEEQENLKNRSVELFSIFTSIVDKAVKKNVIHKNTAARKKSKLQHLLSN